MTEPDVILGAQPLQIRGDLHSSAVEFAISYANALSAAEPARLLGVELDPRLPSPRGLELASDHRSDPAQRRSPPGQGPIVYHVLAAPDRIRLTQLLPRWTSAANVALAVTVDDCLPLGTQDHGALIPPKRAGAIAQLPLLLAADALLAVSDSVAAELVELLGIDERRIHVVGVAAIAAPSRSQRGLQSPALAVVRPGAVMSVATGNEQAHLVRLIDAYATLPAELRADHQLVIVGDLDHRRHAALAGRVATAGVAGDVIITGAVTSADHAAISAGCDLAVFTPEGSGCVLAVLEALHAGLPVLVGSSLPLRELVCDPEAQVVGTTVDAVHEALVRGLTDAGFRDRLVGAAGASAKSCAPKRVLERSLVAYEAACACRGRRIGARKVARPRLAVVTPLPPSRSGIAFYSASLIEALSREVDVDVYREDNVYDEPTALPGVRMMPASSFEVEWELRRTAMPPLYCLGNSRFHVHAWRGLMRHRGDVLLHDVRLNGLYAWLARCGVLTQDELRAGVRRIEGRTAESIFDPDVYMLGEVVDRARRIYVHTEAGRELVLSRRPWREPDMFVVPFAMPVTQARPPAPAGPLVVASFGYLYHGELLLECAAHVLDRRPATRFVLSGAPREPDQLDRLLAIAVQRGIADRVQFDGWVDEDTYATRLAQATIALQLRSFRQGEASASVADCLAAGVPTVTNDPNGSGHLPADAVVRVERDPNASMVAEAVLSLLDDADRRERLATAGRRFAATNTPDHVARTLLELIAEAAPAPRLRDARGRTLTPRDARPSCIVYGNCQADQLRDMLDRSEPFTAAYRTVRIPAAHEVVQATRAGDARAIARLTRAISGAGLIVTQRIRSAYHGLPLGSDDVLEASSPDSTVITIPPMYHDGLFPFHGYVRIGGEHFETGAPMVEYHDLRFLFCAARGWGHAEAVNWLREYEPPPAAVRTIAQQADNALASTRLNVDVSLADSSLMRARQAEHWYTLNHPTQHLMADIAAGVHRLLGLPWEFRPDANDALRFGWLRAPREASTLSALEIRAPARPAWIVSGRAWSLSALLELQLPWYAERPEVLEAGVSEHAERMKLLELAV
jgi:glycosyltransferase involved in cell wall biosynthesis